jgi:hypothetical protein
VLAHPLVDPLLQGLHDGGCIEIQLVISDHDQDSLTVGSEGCSTERA